MAAMTKQETQCCLTAVKSDEVLDSKNVSVSETAKSEFMTHVC